MVATALGSAFLGQRLENGALAEARARDDERHAQPALRLAEYQRAGQEGLTPPEREAELLGELLGRRRAEHGLGLPQLLRAERPSHHAAQRPGRPARSDRAARKR